MTSLIDFAESAGAVERKDLTTALAFANLLPPGIKRTLVYAAMSAAAPDRESAFGPLQLAFKNIEPMAAEHKMLTLAAAANAALRKDSDSGYLAVSELVKASNGAARRPRRAFFDPASARGAFSGTAAAGTETSLILFNERCLCEVIDTGAGRHDFGLRVCRRQRFVAARGGAECSGPGPAAPGRDHSQSTRRKADGGGAQSPAMTGRALPPR